jgi:hypothetical protein
MQVPLNCSTVVLLGLPHPAHLGMNLQLNCLWYHLLCHLLWSSLQGNIAAWRKKEGDSIGPGDILAEIETDKATIEWEAQEEGFLAKIVKPAGESPTPISLHCAFAGLKQRVSRPTCHKCQQLYLVPMLPSLVAVTVRVGVASTSDA